MFLPLQSQTKRDIKNKREARCFERIKDERFTTRRLVANISCTVRESATFFKEISIEV